MAEEREQIIIDVQTNTESTIQKMADLKEQIIGIQDARKELMRLQKQNGDLTAAEARTLAQLDVSLKAARSSYEKLTNEAIREQRTLEQANGVITDSINGMKQALADATAQYNNLSKAEREAAEGQQLMQHIAELSNALAENNETFKNLKSNLNNVGDITETVKARIRELKEELTRLKLEGKDNTEGYKEMLEEAGRLQDGLDDVRKEIQDMANDTRQLSNVIDVFEGVAAGAGVLTGTMEALGVSTDSAEEATKKLVSIMTILKSLQTIQNALMDKSNGLYKLLYNTKSKVVTITNSEAAATKGANSAMQTTDVVVKKATFSFKGLWATLTANPLGLIIGAITGVIAIMNKLQEKANEANEKLKKSQEDIAQNDAEIIQKYAGNTWNSIIEKRSQQVKEARLEYENISAKIAKNESDIIGIRDAAYAAGQGLSKQDADRIGALRKQKEELIAQRKEVGKQLATAKEILKQNEEAALKAAKANRQQEWNNIGKDPDAEKNAAEQAEKEQEAANKAAEAARKKALEEEKRDRERAANEIESYTQQVRTDTQEEELKIAEETYTRLKEEAEKYGWDTTLITEQYEQTKKDIILKWDKKTKEDLKEQQENYDKEALKRIEETEKGRAQVTRDLQIENNAELQALYQQNLDGKFKDTEEFEEKLEELQHQQAIEQFDADIATSQALIDNYTRELENFQGTAEEKQRIEEALAAERVKLSDTTTQKIIANSTRLNKVQGKLDDEEKKSKEKVFKASMSILSSAGEMAADNAEVQKGIQVSEAVINTIAGAVGAFTGITKDTDGWGIAAAIATAAAVTASGMASVKQILDTKIPGSDGGSSSANATAPAPNLSSLASITDSTQAVETLVGDEQIKAQQDTRVYVLESDITSTQNKVNVLESQNSF